MIEKFSARGIVPSRGTKEFRDSVKVVSHDQKRDRDRLCI